MTRTRRSLLKATAVSGAVAVAGCSTILGDGTAAAPGDWLYEPGTIADVDHYLALRYAPAAIADRAGDFDADVYDAMRAFGSDARDLVGFGFADTDAQLVFGRNSVLAAEFDADDVASTLKGEDFVAKGEYEGFDAYVGPDEDAAVGIGDDAVVVAQSTGIFGSADDAERILQAIVDANAGDAESYVEDDADFETLLDALDAGTIQSVRTHAETDSTDTDEGQFRGEVARGVTSTLVDDGVETTFALVFDEAADVDEGDVEDWVATNEDGGTFENFQRTEISVDDRVVLVTGTEPTSAFDFFLADI
ncbi:oligoendopeptidase F family protein [Halorubellus sp. JP-L1]|uniref:oligoendopeptidase F family protein n=1 Tax=Halorubellus sp. JP-L1 TaxID=2715753 RepID=UPI00140AB020|nr:oligoendopeptidase F family protein [Halorubellus sp. JP-L1]NHN42153.1 oligoendopeptidase F family protein [Halorubellus sp. JP-L1]